MTDPKLRVIIEVVDRASKQIASIANANLTSLRRMRMQMALLGAAVVGFAALSVKAAQNQRIAMFLLNRSLAALGPGFAAMGPEVEQAIDDMAELTGISKEELAAAFTILVTKTGNVGLALKALAASANLAKGTNKALGESAEVVAAALTGDDKAREILFNLQVEVPANLPDITAQLDLLTGINKRFGNVAFDMAPKTLLAQEALGSLFATLGGSETAGSQLDILIKGFTGFINRLDDFLKKNPQVVTAIQVLAVAFGVLAVAVTVITAVLIAWVVVASIVSVPVLAIIAVVVLLGALVFILATQWREAWEQIKTEAAMIWEFLKGLWDTTFQWLTEKMPNTMKALSVLFGFIWDVIQGIATRVWNALSFLFPKAWKWLLSTLPDALGFLRGVWNTTWKAIQSVAETVMAVIDGIVGRVIAAINTLRSLASEAIGFARQVIPGFQSGGMIASNRVALVGERGPELVALPGGSRVIPNGQLQGGGGGGGLVIAFNGPVYGMSDFEARVAEAVRSVANRGGFNRVFS